VFIVEKLDVIINELENIKVNQGKFESRVDDKFDKIDDKFDRIDNKFDRIEVNTSKIPVIETKIGVLEESVTEIKADVKNIRDNHLFHMSEDIGKLQENSKWSDRLIKVVIGGFIVIVATIVIAIAKFVFGG
jgi:hypothetical protein